MGKLAVVSGGGTGIGTAIARVLVEDGYQVVIIGRRAEVLAATAGELGDAVRPVVADLTSVSDVDRVVSTVDGEVDVLVNNAGGFDVEHGDGLAGTAGWWRRVYDSNVLVAETLVGGPGGRRTSRRRCVTWPARTPGTSPGRSCPSTVASCSADERRRGPHEGQDRTVVGRAGFRVARAGYGTVGDLPRGHVAEACHLRIANRVVILGRRVRRAEQRSAHRGGRTRERDRDRPAARSALTKAARTRRSGRCRSARSPRPRRTWARGSSCRRRCRSPRGGCRGSRR